MCIKVYSSVIMGKGAIVRDCRVIRRVGVMCKVGIIDFSVSG
jgi:ribosomal protein L36